MWLGFLTFDLLIKIVILHALLAVSMTNILLVILFSANPGLLLKTTWSTNSNPRLIIIWCFGVCVVRTANYIAWSIEDCGTKSLAGGADNHQF